MGIVVDYDYLDPIEVHGKALIEIAADCDLELPVPTCPDWTLRDLLEHVAGSNRWVTKCVSERLTPQERILPPGPPGRDELKKWSQESLDELLIVLSATAPEELVWTPIQGPLGSTWWRRTAAIEGAIHRNDAEDALSMNPETIDSRLALGGIDEYAEEFLPLMLHAVPEQPPVTALLLSPTDIDDSRLLSLIPAGDDRDPGPAEVELNATASDLLLWMWNRVPDGTVAVRGDDAVMQWWKVLAI